MKGDSCSRHKDRIAIGYGSTSCSGLNVCVECAKGYSGKSLNLYGITKQDEKVFSEKLQRQNKSQLENIQNGNLLKVCLIAKKQTILSQET